MFKRILVPIDGSATSNLGIREALRLAADGGAKIRLVHVVDELVLMTAPDATAPIVTEDLIRSLVDGGKKILAKARSMVEKGGGRAETSLIESFGGGAADSIVKDAKKWGADVIVIGTHGRRGFRRVLLGSDAEQVVRASPVPVMLVRDRSGEKKARR